MLKILNLKQRSNGTVKCLKGFVVPLILNCMTSFQDRYFIEHIDTYSFNSQKHSRG